MVMIAKMPKCQKKIKKIKKLSILAQVVCRNILIYLKK
jgi:hypothetical protein